MPTRRCLPPSLCTLALSLLAATGTYAATGSAADHNVFRWGPFLAPFHAVVLHFPIGFLVMAFVLEVYRWRRPIPDIRPIISLTLWLSLISGLIAASFGILRATDGGYEVHELESHRWTGIGVVAATLLTIVAQRFTRGDGKGAQACLAYRAALVLTISLVVIAGHKGGNLTHGAKYLTENAPPFVREIMGEEPSSSEAAPSSADLNEQQQFYVDHVQPILEKKCIRCHGPEKQKGDYRLDRAESALTAGESGKAAIKPGDPFSSELVRLVLLPPEDDEVMPPSGKEALTAEEMLTIIRWIQKGASFPVAAVEGASRKQ